MQPNSTPPQDSPYAGNVLSGNNLLNWEKAKKWVNSNYQLPVEIAKDVNPILNGTHGKDQHPLQVYSHTFPQTYPHITAAYSWARCPKCNNTRWIKLEAFFAGNPPVSYHRYVNKREE